MEILNYLGSKASLRTFFIAFFGLWGLFSSELSGQSLNFCGQFPSHQATTNNPDSVYYDRFGNSYDLYPTDTIAPTDTIIEIGHFVLHINDNVNSTYIDVIEQVFGDISDLLKQRQLYTSCNDPITQDKIHIEIEESSAIIYPILATGSPFFMGDNSKNGCEYMQNANVFVKMNGVHFYNDVMDGRIEINSTFADFFTGYPGSVPPTKIDLYTVVYHEALHILAFHPRTTLSGRTFFSGYDHLLYAAGNRMTTSNCVENCYTTDYATVSPTTCNIRVGLSGPGVAGYADLAHLAETASGCGNDNYIMNPGISYGSRTPIHTDEINILCGMGYKTTSCDGEFSLPFEGLPRTTTSCSEYENCCKRIFYTCGNTITIPKSELMCFAHANIGYEVTDAFVPFSLPASISMSATNITVTKTGSHWASDIDIEITYTDANCKSATENIYIFFDPTCQQNNCEFEDECENILCFGDLENFDETADVWLGYPFIFDGKCNSSPDITTYPSGQNNKVIHIGYDEEAFVLQMNNAPYNKCDLNLTFTAGSMAISTIKIWGSKMPPCHMNETPIPQSCTSVSVNCGSYLYEPVCLGSISVTNTNSLNPYSLTIPAALSSDLAYLIFSQTGSNVYLDDFQLTSNCATDATFAVSEIYCKKRKFTPNTISNKAIYDWDFGDGNTSTDNSPEHTYATNGTYTVTLTVSDECGNSKSSTATVIIQNCLEAFTCQCTGANSYNIDAGSGTLLSSILYPSGGYINACLAIKGRLIIDQNLLISGGEVRMQPGSEIEIKSNYNLYITNVNVNEGIHGCDAMWKGILINPNAYLGMDLSMIKDAVYAVKALGGSSLWIEDNLFDRNYEGIHVPNNGGTPQTIYHTALTGNRFTCDGSCAMLPPYSGQTYPPQDMPYTGINISDATFKVGVLGNPSLANSFQNLRNAIQGHHSSILFYTNYIDNMIEDANTVNYYDPTGVGVWLEKEGQSIIKGNVITNALAGVVSRDYSSDISDNNITKVGEGIFVSEAYSGPKVQNNYIEYHDVGITVRYPNATTTPEIIDNTVSAYVGSNYNIGIKLLKLQTMSASALTRVQDNVLNLNNLSTGIYLSDCNHVGMQTNTLTFANAGTSPGASAEGISLYDSDFNTAYNNTVNGDNYQQNALAITALISPSNTYCCNQTGKTFFGMNFSGMCDQSIIRHNSIGSHFTGLNCDLSTITGVQTHGGNTWDGSTYGIHASHGGNFTERTGSRFIVNTCSMPLWPATIYPAQSCTNGTDWFRLQLGATTNCSADQLCASPFEEFLPEDPKDELTENDQKLARGEFNESEYAAMLNWEKGKQLFRKLMRAPDLLGQVDEIDAFYYKNLNGPLHNLLQVDDEVLKMLSPDPEMKIELRELEENRGIKQADLELIEAQLLLSPDDADLIAQRNMLLEELASINTAIDELWKQYTEIKISSISEILAMNQEVMDTTLIQRYEKTINQVYLNTIATGNRISDPQQASDVYHIAGLCPMEYGGVVYRARTLYELIAHHRWMDRDNCQPEIRTRKLDEKAVDPLYTDIHIRPNPAGNEVFVTWNSNDFVGQQIRFNLISTHGRIVNSCIENKNAGKVYINTTDIPEGIYFIRIFEDNRYIDTRKIVILH